MGLNERGLLANVGVEPTPASGTRQRPILSPAQTDALREAFAGRFLAMADQLRAQDNALDARSTRPGRVIPLVPGPLAAVASTLFRR